MKKNCGTILQSLLQRKRCDHVVTVLPFTCICTTVQVFVRVHEIRRKTNVFWSTKKYLVNIKNKGNIPTVGFNISDQPSHQLLNFLKFANQWKH